MISKGIVINHTGVGSKLGFPTANLDIQTSLPEGIYLARTSYKKQTWPSLVFAGQAQTFDDPTLRFEVYILDFSGDLYGQEIEVEVLDKIRENIRFSSKEELVEQMKKDEQVAREYFGLTSQS